MGKFIDLSGRAFGMLTAIARASERNRHITWICKCACGNECEVKGLHLKNGHTQSCGCYRNAVCGARARTHGETGTRIYTTWKSMKHRCYNTNNSSYRNYGGRGIRVCDRWLHSFTTFAKDMGPKPPNHSIERINNNGDYSPNNCRWATAHEQTRNTRRNTKLTFKGETKLLCQWAEETGIHVNTILGRFRMGYSVEDALTTPVSNPK